MTIFVFTTYHRDRYS